MTHRSLDETENPRSKDRFAILVSTNMSRESESWASAGPSTGVASFQTNISSQKIKEVDLDQSLPPPPKSEIPQVSPAAASFHKCFMTGGITPVLEQASIARSILGAIGQVPSNTPFDEDQNDSFSREISRWTYSTIGLEILARQDIRRLTLLSH